MREQQLDPKCTRLRPLADYSYRLPSSRRGKRINRATLWRWALSGARGGIKLRTDVLGSCRYTCDAYVCEFMRQLSEPQTSVPVAVAVSDRTREQIIERFGLHSN